MIGHGRRNLAKAGAPQSATGPLEMGAVCKIEGLGAKFSAGALCDSEFSEKRQIDIDQFRAIQDVTAGCAKFSWRRLGKCSHIEPLLTRTDATQYRGCAGQIRAIVVVARCIEAGIADPDV